MKVARFLNWRLTAQQIVPDVCNRKFDAVDRAAGNYGMDATLKCETPPLASNKFTQPIYTEFVCNPAIFYQDMTREIL